MWADDLYRKLARNAPAFTFDMDDVDAWVEWVSDLDEAAVSAAARAVMLTPPHRFPTGPQVRHRVFLDLGLIAPSWGEAVAAATKAFHDPDVAVWRSLPGPVRTIDVAALDAGGFAGTHQAAYEAAAEAHNRWVLTPGNLPELAAVGVYERELRAVLDNRALPAAEVERGAGWEPVPGVRAAIERIVKSVPGVN